MYIKFLIGSAIFALICMAMAEQSEGLNCMAVDRMIRSKYVRWKERMH